MSVPLCLSPSSLVLGHYGFVLLNLNTDNNNNNSNNHKCQLTLRDITIIFKVFLRWSLIITMVITVEIGVITVDFGVRTLDIGVITVDTGVITVDIGVIILDIRISI